MKEQLNEQQVQLLAAAMGEAFRMVAEGKKGAYAHTHTGITLHGPGGIFSTFGLNREIINAHIAPTGIANLLPLLPSMDTDPRFGTVTGVTGSVGDQPTETCEAAPHAYLKGCNLTARFGRIRFDTNTIEWDKVMTRYNRGDFMDLMFLGSMLGAEDVRAGLVPTDISETDMLNIVTLAEMLVVGVQAQREIVRQTWQGNIFIDNEFPGLDGQIATGQMDADRPGVLCTALDADVKNFGYADVCGTARDIVEYVSMLHWYLRHNATRSKLTPVKWALVLRPELWFELSACWPCRYQTNRCQDAAGTQVAVINDENNVSMRDAMREGMFLWVNGEKIQVVTDDGIFEHDSTNDAHLLPGEFASSIYMVPLTILGTFPVTYREYLNYRSPVAQANVAPFAGSRRPDFWSDNGVFSWAYDGQLWCYLLGLKTEQRVILRTPQLSGRIDHVKYTPTQHLRSPYPDSEYFRDGGSSIGPPQRSSYAVWASGLVPR
jgi:hypothetical protein